MRTIPPMKHVIQNYNTSVNLNAGGTNVVILAQGTENPDPYTNSVAVRNGSIVTSMTFQIEWTNYSSLTAAGDAIDFYIWFNIAGAQTRPNPTAINVSKLKNQVFHQDGSLMRCSAATQVAFQYPPVSKWRFTISIPKAYQQINFGDQIEICYVTQANNAFSDFKLTCIYKEIFP